MTREMLQRIYIQKAKGFHGPDQYDYSKVDYSTGKLPVIIICRIHGEFSQKLKKHSEGSICPECLDEFNKTRKLKYRTHEEFVEESIRIHGDINEYHERFTSLNQHMIITCKIHGNYIRRCKDHLKGQGCKICGNIKQSKNQQMPLEEALRLAREEHGDKYDYTDVIERYDGVSKIYKIICPIHGNIMKNRLFKDHIGSPKTNADGCDKCANLAKFYTHDEFLKKAELLHHHKYIYKTQYKGSKQDLVISCPIHGEFVQSGQAHLAGHGCGKCSTQGGITNIFFRLNQDFINFPAYLYFFKLHILTTNETYLKVGISRNEPKNRLRAILVNKNIIGEVLFVENGLFFNTFNAEQHLLKQFINYRGYIEEKFGGRTECFDYNKCDEIFEYFNNHLKQGLLEPRSIEYVRSFT